MSDQQASLSPAETFEHVRSGIVRIARESLDLAEGFPGEIELARRLGCGRAQVRRVMGSLEHEGIVIRKQGVPTRIDRAALALTERLDVRLSVAETLELRGFTPSVRLLRSEVRTDTDVIGRDASGDAPISTIEVLHSADGAPAVFERTDLVLRTPADAAVDGSLDERIEAIWGEPALWEVASVSVTPVGDDAAGALGLAPGAHVALLDGIHVLRSGRRIARSRRWHNPGYFQYSVLRVPALP